MELKNICLTRQATRDFTDKKIAKEEIDYILECARLSPSACNFQPWKVFVLQSDSARQMVASFYDRQWALNAPLYMVVCIDHSAEWVRSSDQKRHGVIDASIITEHICLAAAEKGIGTCWVCNFDVKKCAELLGLPQSVEPAVLIPMGYSDIPVREKDRKPVEEFVTIL